VTRQGREVRAFTMASFAKSRAHSREKLLFRAKLLVRFLAMNPPECIERQIASAGLAHREAVTRGLLHTRRFAPKIPCQIDRQCAV
jgi:hypothetical protein